MISDEIRKKLNGVTLRQPLPGIMDVVLADGKTVKAKAVVYMPKGSSQERLDAILREGAVAEIVDMNYDDAVRMTAEMAEKNTAG